MIRPALAILAGLAIAAIAPEAAAEPGKVLVLPLDGDADPELRARYSASVQRLARTLGGKVVSGDVTFTDTATAIGCDPQVPACAEDVRATLGVDELVYGTVVKEGGKLVLTVRRTTKGQPRREVSAKVEASDAPDRVEPELLPLFREASGSGEPAAPLGAEAPPQEETPLPPPPHRRRAIGCSGTPRWPAAARSC